MSIKRGVPHCFHESRLTYFDGMQINPHSGEPYPFFVDKFCDTISETGANVRFFRELCKHLRKKLRNY